MASFRCLRAGQIGAERFFDDHSPRSVGFFRQAAGAEAFDGGFVKLRRDCQIVQPRGRRALFNLCEQFRQLGIVAGGFQIARLVVDRLGELFPRRRVPILLGKLLCRFRELFAPLVVREGGARNADDIRPLRQTLLAIKREQGWYQLAACEIARGPEYDNRVWHPST